MAVECQNMMKKHNIVKKPLILNLMLLTKFVIHILTLKYQDAILTNKWTFKVEVKVRKSQNQIIMSSILTKNERWDNL